MEYTISEKFRKIIKYKRKIHREFLESYGLHYGQPRLLTELLNHDQMTQSDLVNALEVSKESVSTSVKRLTKSGHIVSHVDAHDKRVKRLSLSPKGKEVIIECIKGLDEINESVFSGLNQEEKETLSQLFDKVLKEMGEQDAQNT